MSNVKGVILAGGRGSRLCPMTEYSHKTLMPVYDKPMILHVVEKMKSSGIDEIMIILGGNSVGDIISLLGNGQKYGVFITYKFQEKMLGVADALSLACDFIGDDKFMLMLGDNFIFDDLTDDVQSFINQEGAKVFLKEVLDPRRFGVAVIKDGKIIDIEEKPNQPKSNLAITGVYFYDSDVFDLIKLIEPSKRGEYEITDVNKLYLKEGKLNYGLLEKDWVDAGTPEGLFKATNLIRQIKRHKP